MVKWHFFTKGLWGAGFSKKTLSESLKISFFCAVNNAVAVLTNANASHHLLKNKKCLQKWFLRLFSQRL